MGGEVQDLICKDARFLNTQLYIYIYFLVLLIESHQRAEDLIYIPQHFASVETCELA